MNELMQQFLSEARDFLESIASALLSLERSPDDAAMMDELFRYVHTLKGNCGLFDFPDMFRVIHAAEDLMSEVRGGQIAYTRQLADLLLEALDFIAQQLDTIEQTGEAGTAGQASAVALAARLRQLCGGASETSLQAEAPASGPAQAPHVAAALALAPAAVSRQCEAILAAGQDLYFIEYVPESECFFKGEDPLYQAMQTPGIVWQKIVPASSWPALDELDPYHCSLRFQMLSSASMDALAEHYRYVPEQVAIHAVDTLAPSELTPWDPDALAIVQAQGQALWTPDGTAWVAGRMLGAVATIRAVLQASSRTIGLQALDAASAASLQSNGPEPLLAWLEEYAVSPAAAVAAEPQRPALQAPSGAVPVAGMPAAASATEVQAATARRDEAAAPRVLKVEQARVDRLMNLIGEMVVARNSLPYLAARAEDQYGVRELGRDIKAQHTVINRIVEEMQDAIMHIRMTPMSFVFQRFPRLVRDIARKLGKEVELVLEGAETEADRNVIEALADPLVHIVRNALDHGIEMPHVRASAGKPACGKLLISARREGDRVLIEIRDDGKGIDPDAIARKAYQRGLIDEARLERIDRRAALDLVFAPGLSTAEQVTDLSGRGVGMDAVRSAVEALGGAVEIDSEVGHGTCLRLALPLSMAVTNVMVVQSGGALYGVPMELVLETVRIPACDIHSVGQRQAAVLRERIVPLRSLNELLALDTPQEVNDAGELATLVLRLQGQEVGLVIDNFRDVMEVILKPLGGILGSVGAYAGSALMGDGTVMLVLNPKELLQ